MGEISDISIFWPIFFSNRNFFCRTGANITHRVQKKAFEKKKDFRPCKFNPKILVFFPKSEGKEKTRALPAGLGISDFFLFRLVDMVLRTSYASFQPDPSSDALEPRHDVTSVLTSF